MATRHGGGSEPIPTYDSDEEASNERAWGFERMGFDQCRQLASPTRETKLNSIVSLCPAGRPWIAHANVHAHTSRLMPYAPGRSCPASTPVS